MITSTTHPIIGHSAEVSGWVRFVNVALTIIIWLSYLYLIQESFIFISDVVRWALNGFDGMAGYSSFRILPTIVSYAAVVFAFGVVYISWALYNQMRFRGNSKRKSSPPVTFTELAEIYDLSSTAVEQWQKSKNLVMHHDDTGQLMEIKAA